MCYILFENYIICEHHSFVNLSRVTLYIEAKALKYPLTQYFEYKERNPTSHKGFIILQSEREPTKEVATHPFIEQKNFTIAITGRLR